MIKNLVLDNTCSVSGASYVAGIAGGTSGTGTVTFRNVGNEVAVTASGLNAAEIVGVSMGGTINFSITNCYNTGDVTGSKQSAAICAYVGKKSVLKNIYNTGKIGGYDSADKKLYRNTCTSSCLYDIEGMQGDSITPEMLASGEFAFILNCNLRGESPWYQSLDNELTPDGHPTLSPSHGTVYALGTLNCNGTASGDVSGYSNTDKSVRTPHEFENGICSVCEDVEPGFVTMTDSVYEIGTAAQLNWFANYVNLGTVNAKAKLTDNIDYTEYTTVKSMIGKESAGISGWLGLSAELTNCYNIGSVTGMQADRLFARYSARPYFVNCYETIGNQVINVTIEQVENGALCYMLNDSVSGGDTFFQTLGEDLHPVLFGSRQKVYEVNGSYTNNVVGIRENAIDKSEDGKIQRIYSVDGVRRSNLQKGINIVINGKGKAKKVYVK